MSGKRAKALMEEARLKSLDGSVVKSHEYNRLKKTYINPSYSPVVVLHPTKPGLKFSASYKKQKTA